MTVKVISQEADLEIQRQNTEALYRNARETVGSWRGFVAEVFDYFWDGYDNTWEWFDTPDTFGVVLSLALEDFSKHMLETEGLMQHEWIVAVEPEEVARILHHRINTDREFRKIYSDKAFKYANDLPLGTWFSNFLGPGPLARNWPMGPEQPQLELGETK